ncbi:hypothetical protein [Pararhodobacter sp.]|uniref:hypothetical protein n=1 Tax=Pararhodobacter sp. TaxID=2127056 RepID=UPI002FDE8C08
MSRTPEINGLEQLISLADGGEYLPLLQSELATLIADLHSHATIYNKSAGKLNLSIGLAFDRKGQVDLVIEHKITAPKMPKAKGSAWSIPGGKLTVENPAQRRMEIREVEGGKRELRSPGA